MSPPESSKSTAAGPDGVRPPETETGGSSGASEWRLRLILLAFSLIFALICGEIALRVLASGAPPAVASESGFTFFAHHPRLGWDLVPNAADRHEGAEFDVEIRIDSRGLRSPHDYASEPAAGIRRLVVLGDSFTFGHGVEAAEAWPALLEDRLPNLEAPNLAVTGYGTDQQLLRFEQRSEELRPDAVILGLFAGNVFRNGRFEQLGYAKPRFVYAGDELRLEGVPVPEEPPPISGSRLARLLGGTLKSVGEHLGYGEAWDVTGGILDRLTERAAASGAPLFVVVLPKDQMIYGGGPRRTVHERMHRRLHSLLEQHGVAYLDLTDALRAAASSDRLYYPKDGHWTVAGHRVAADAIASWLGPQLPQAPVSDMGPSDSEPELPEANGGDGSP